jgi:outer membrane protein
MKKLLAIAITAATPMMAQADLLFTVDAGASVWNAEATGTTEGKSTPSFDLADDLGLDTGANNVFFVSFEHPIPVLPNIKIMKTDLDLSGDNSSQIDLSHTDLTMYWGLPLPIPYIDINFGLTARQFDGGIVYSSLAGSINEKLDFTMPMGYLNVDVGTPFGIYARANLNALSFDGNGVTDTEIAVGYTLPIPLIDVNLEAGHRAIGLTTDKDTVDVETDIDVSGLFFGLNVSIGL